MNKLHLHPVNCCEGAPMGRPDHMPDDQAAPVKLRLERLRLVDHAYDSGGAYWGCNGPQGVMWCAWSADGVRMFRRARTRDDAKKKVREALPSVRFCR